jgi:hypothetical protein
MINGDFAGSDRRGRISIRGHIGSEKRLPTFVAGSDALLDDKPDLIGQRTGDLHEQQLRTARELFEVRTLLNPRGSPASARRELALERSIDVVASSTLRTDDHGAQTERIVSAEKQLAHTVPRRVGTPCENFGNSRGVALASERANPHGAHEMFGDDEGATAKCTVERKRHLHGQRTQLHVLGQSSVLQGNRRDSMANRQIEKDVELWIPQFSVEERTEGQPLARRDRRHPTAVAAGDLDGFFVEPASPRADRTKGVKVRERERPHVERSTVPSQDEVPRGHELYQLREERRGATALAREKPRTRLERHDSVARELDAEGSF